MRLWSLHPKYLDQKGLIALWREGLLAQKVLAGKTKGYVQHPQLIRFRLTKDPMAAIGFYLTVLAEEATRRGYQFDVSKIQNAQGAPRSIPVSRGQVRFEVQHLLQKLKFRDPAQYIVLMSRKRFSPHASFTLVRGNIHSWERIHQDH